MIGGQGLFRASTAHLQHYMTDRLVDFAKDTRIRPGHEEVLMDLTLGTANFYRGRGGMGRFFLGGKERKGSYLLSGIDSCAARLPVDRDVRAPPDSPLLVSIWCVWARQVDAVSSAVCGPATRLHRVHRQGRTNRHREERITAHYPYIHT